MFRVKQTLTGPVVKDIKHEVDKQWRKASLGNLISPGMNVAVAVGSRGIANLGLIVQVTCQAIKAKGARPFIVPAMGSHGGATAEGQQQLLQSLGITEELCGAPIISSMDVVEIGMTKNGTPVYMDRNAWHADGVILVNRIKSHTDFHSSGGFESGLMKMSVIGLGKHEQAKQIHADGVRGLKDILPEAAKLVLSTGKVLAGVALVENAREETAIIEVLSADQIAEREPLLLEQARCLMPSLPVPEIDILLVDQIGKEFSGTGMDTNVIGRIGILGEDESQSPRIKYIVASDLTDASHGNALGVGLADFTTRRLFDKIDFRVMNENVLTSTFVRRGMIPVVLDNTSECLRQALRCNWGVPPEQARVIRIPNTLHLEEMYLSPSLLEEVGGQSNLTIDTGCELEFDKDGYAIPFKGGKAHF